MNSNAARQWILSRSLLMLVLCLLGFGFGPFLGYPLTQDQTEVLLLILTPSFVTVLGAAAVSVSGTRPLPAIRRTSSKGQILAIVLKGPFIVGTGVLVTVAFVFAWTNRASAPIGTGMPFVELQRWIAGTTTVCFGLSSAAAARLFSGGE